MSAAPSSSNADEEKKRLATERNMYLQKVLTAPLVCLPIAFSAYFIYGGKDATPRWWHLHPLAMMVAFISLGGISVRMKKVGGRDNTIWHGYLMFFASVVSGFGSYVMWTNKEMYKKEHMTTTHSYVGGLAMMMTFFAPIGTWIALNPVNGVARTNQNVRWVHKYSSKLALAVAYAAICTGILSVEKNELKAYGMVASVLALAGFIVF